MRREKGDVGCMRGLKAPWLHNSAAMQRPVAAGRGGRETWEAWRQA